MDSHKPGFTEPLGPAGKKQLSESQYDSSGRLQELSLKTVVTKKGKVLPVVPRDFIPPRPCRITRSNQIDFAPLEEKTPQTVQHLSIYFNQGNLIGFDEIVIERKSRKRQQKLNAAQNVRPKNAAQPKTWQSLEPVGRQLGLKEIMKEEKSIQRHPNKSPITKNEPTTASSPERIAQDQQLIKRFLRLWQFHEIPLNSVYELKAADLVSSEVDYIKTLFNKTMQSYTIESIKRVVNPYLLLSYHLKKATKNTYAEKLLFHGTKVENVDSICIDNFDWRLVSKHKFGKGVSFATTPCFAKHYQDRSGNTKVMFAVKVLVGLAFRGKPDNEVPLEPYDTTTDESGHVYVKYDDCSFYPAYLIYYQKK